MLYPWLTTAYQQLAQQLEQNRLPHALLLVGPNGLGKEAAALHFCQLLHCTAPNHNEPCGHCDACVLFSAGNCPDHLLITPEEAGKNILIEQIRAVVKFSHHTAIQGGYRTVVVSPAERMNWNAQNALLKTLEEPGSKTLLILVVEQLNHLLPTVISRCQQRSLQPPVWEEGLHWLQEQGITEAEAKGLLLSARGAPLQALALQEKPWFQRREQIFHDIASIQTQAARLPQVAKMLAEFDAHEFLSALYHWLAQTIKVQSGVLEIKDEALSAGINALKSLRRERIFAFQEAVVRAQTLWLSGANPNKEILYEQLLMVLLGVPLARDIVHAY